MTATEDVDDFLWRLRLDKGFWILSFAQTRGCALSNAVRANVTADAQRREFAV